ncbi:MAG: Uma2 family endonuclease [Acidobacteria bacterium]|nr:Uma2 family endonuclease [Acidobacteriota bacterium]
MATKALISEEEYLRTSYPDLDCEYRNGEILERTLPDYRHARTQKRLIVIFDRLEALRVPLFVCPELRLRLAKGLYRIPDVCVFSPEQPSESVPSTPPLIAIEISSPDDRLTRIREKLEEYRQWGVPYVWLVDPHSRRLYGCTSAGLSEVPSFRVAEFDLEITAPEIFD